MLCDLVIHLYLLFSWKVIVAIFVFFSIYHSGALCSLWTEDNSERESSKYQKTGIGNKDEMMDALIDLPIKDECFCHSLSQFWKNTVTKSFFIPWIKLLFHWEIYSKRIARFQATVHSIYSNTIYKLVEARHKWREHFVAGRKGLQRLHS